MVANDLGAAFSFHDTEQLARTIERFTDRSLLSRLSLRAQAFFTSTFNWDTVSEGFYAELRKRFGVGPRERRYALFLVD